MPRHKLNLSEMFSKIRPGPQKRTTDRDMLEQLASFLDDLFTEDHGFVLLVYPRYQSADDQIRTSHVLSNNEPAIVRRVLISSANAMDPSNSVPPEVVDALTKTAGQDTGPGPGAHDTQIRSGPIVDTFAARWAMFEQRLAQMPTPPSAEERNVMRGTFYVGGLEAVAMIAAQGKPVTDEFMLRLATELETGLTLAQLPEPPAKAPGDAP